MDILYFIKEKGLNPKRKAACHGGEYCSPCPFCGEGDDRFLIWPKRHNKNGEYTGGRFCCRVCGSKGDAINFIREIYGLSYLEACEKLNVKPRDSIPNIVPQKKPKLPLALDPPILWCEKAKAFVDWCHAQLLSDPNALAFVMRRGFTRESIVRFKLGFNPKVFYRDLVCWGLEPELKENNKPKKLWLPAGIVIPTFSSDGKVIRLKIRRTEEDIQRDVKQGRSELKYIEIKGLKKCYSVYGNTSLTCALVLESELDGLLIQQFTSDLIFCVALGGASKSLDLDTDALLRNTPNVLFCPDYDDAGALAWVKWKKMFPSIQRILTPDGKAPGDAFLAGVDLRGWIVDKLKLLGMVF